MRLRLAGAFPFPAAQGSQVYLADQMQALEAAGASCERLSYAELPALVAPRRVRSGPSWRKPMADGALVMAMILAQRRRPADALLAHNAEAAVAGIFARMATGVPVFYVAHTVLRYELSAYGPSPWRAALDRVGSAIDGWIARRAEGIIALSEDARALLQPQARCEVAVVPPGLDLQPEPEPALTRRVCEQAGVEPGRFVLYAGNLDAYQDLELLDAAASLLGPRELPVVAATHDARDGRRRHPNLRIVEFARFGEMRALQFAASVLVLTRRRPGGFPIKLLNYMEAERPIVAFERIAPGLRDDVHARLLAEDAGPELLARELRSLLGDEARAKRLGAAARKQLIEQHAWPDLAQQTLDFVTSLSPSAS